MNRKAFLTNTCSICIGAGFFSGLLNACNPTRYVTGKMNNDGVLLDAREFLLKGEKKYRSFIVVRNEMLLFPICVYRFSKTEYSALWMQCTHQGTELNVAGDFLQCPAHGSEFNSKGVVKNGPADHGLRTFPVTIKNNQIFIDLRKV